MNYKKITITISGKPIKLENNDETENNNDKTENNNDETENETENVESSTSEQSFATEECEKLVNKKTENKKITKKFSDGTPI